MNCEELIIIVVITCLYAVISISIVIDTWCDFKISHRICKLFEIK